MELKEEESKDALTDGDPDTYWETDGSQGRHWILLPSIPQKHSNIFSLPVCYYSFFKLLCFKVQILHFQSLNLYQQLHSADC